MERERLTHFKKKLEEMRDAETQNAQNLKDGMRAPFKDSTGELSSYDNHPADTGDVSFEREKDLGLILLAEERLVMIAEALASMGKGTYGRCESCGGEISMERLEAIPYTNMCQDCRQKYEGRERQNRPIEEKIINPPFGRIDPDNNAFDGEDAWQAVARYGTANSPSDIGSVDDYNDVYVNSHEDIGTVEE